LRGRSIGAAARGAATVCAVLLGSLLAAGCQQGGPAPAASHSRSPATSAAPSTSPSPSTPSSPGASGQPGLPASEAALIARLTPRQLAGQRVIWSYRGLNPPADLVSAIKHGQAAGIIFFGENIASPAQIVGVIRGLEADNRSPDNPVHAPLLLMTDQEGGNGVLGIKRLPGAPYLSERQIGESANPLAQARIAGAGAAATLRRVGMNVNLAPVLDVYRSPGDFIDSLGRSYSMNPSVAAQLGTEFIAAQQHAGVAATAKHFPGLGAAAAGMDTDLQPVTINLPASTLRSVDELPYGLAIRAGVKLVMVSWAVYPSLDPARPAGLSARIVQGELRDRLGFRGVTITDAIGAGALAAYGNWANRSALAAGAGMDLVLCTGTVVRGGPVCVNGIESGYNHGRLGKPAFRLAVARVLALRASLAH
jgi:beta-N-acetylhexosaminidase